MVKQQRYDNFMFYQSVAIIYYYHEQIASSNDFNGSFTIAFDNANGSFATVHYKFPNGNFYTTNVNQEGPNIQLDLMRADDEWVAEITQLQGLKCSHNYDV